LLELEKNWPKHADEKHWPRWQACIRQKEFILSQLETLLNGASLSRLSELAARSGAPEDREALMPLQALRALMQASLALHQQNIAVLRAGMEQQQQVMRETRQRMELVRHAPLAGRQPERLDVSC
jgi:hypothetical protein